MPALLLIRHGENEYTRTGKLAGWTPGVRLNEAGRRQAEARFALERNTRLTVQVYEELVRA